METIGTKHPRLWWILLDSTSALTGSFVKGGLVERKLGFRGLGFRALGL